MLQEERELLYKFKRPTSEFTKALIAYLNYRHGAILNKFETTNKADELYRLQGGAKEITRLIKLLHSQPVKE